MAEFEKAYKSFIYEENARYTKSCDLGIGVDDSINNEAANSVGKHGCEYLSNVGAVAEALVVNYCCIWYAFPFCYLCECICNTNYVSDINGGCHVWTYIVISSNHSLTCLGCLNSGDESFIIIRRSEIGA
jgi:hypothetical protein